MKRTIPVVFLLLYFISPLSAQWKDVSFNLPILAFGVHDTSFFVSDTPDFSDRARIYRYAPMQGPPSNWAAADGGIDRTQGNITSFASLGNFVFAGLTQSNGDNGATYSSLDNGATWTKIIGAPIASNGSYLYAQYASHVARSSDGGKHWEHLTAPIGKSYATIGWTIFANYANGTYRSLDSGTNWTKLSPPFSGAFTVMGSLLFITGNNSVVVSIDNGSNWSTVSVDTAGENETINVLASDGTHLFAGTNNGVLFSDDTGRSWHVVNYGLPSDHNVTMLGVFDTLLFANMPGHVQYYTAVRPISEMIPPKGAVASMPSLARDTIGVFPNPSTGIVTIRGGSDILRVSIIDVLGHETGSEFRGRAAGEIQLDLSSLPSGSYFLRIETEKGTVVRKVVRE